MNEKYTFTMPRNQAIKDAVETIEKTFKIGRAELLQALDAQCVKHGRWGCVGHDDTTYWYRCSVCGHEEHDNMTKHDSHCSSCGAIMDLKDGGTK